MVACDMAHWQLGAAAESRAEQSRAEQIASRAEQSNRPGASQLVTMDQTHPISQARRCKLSSVLLLIAAN
jgi:hypothetical protein